MKLKKVLIVMLTCMIALSSLVSFVGCTNEITEDVGNASVSFATSVSKALNQDGSTNTGVTQEVGDFYWKYYCSTTAPTLTNDTWTAFFTGDDADTKGLGKIEGLIKGENYYFGLRGYSSNTFEDNKLVWEGFHYSDATTKTLESVKLTSKTQLITIDVFTAGIGRLFFNFTAPAVNGFCITGDNAAHFKDGDTVKYDYFSYTLSDLTGQILSTATDLVIDGTKSGDSDTIYYDADEDTFYYANSTGRELDAGTYLMTIWQNSWNCDADGGAKYQQVSQRKQVLIINIVPGVDTIVSGSLDSTALDVIDYEANGYTEENQKHMQVIFHAANTSKVAPLSVTSKTPSGGTAIVNDNDRIEVYNGQYVEFSWTSDTNVRIYVNGDELDLETTDSRDDFGTGSTIAFYTRKTDNTTLYNYVAYLAEGTKDSVRAYGKAGLDYIVTIETVATDQQNNQSMSFTIVGKADNVTKAVGESLKEDDLEDTTSSATAELSIKTSGSSISIANAVIDKSAVLDKMQEIMNSDSDNEQYSATNDNEITLTLLVSEIEKAESSSVYSIDMKATAVAKEAGTDNVVYNSGEVEVKSFSSYVTTSVQLEKNLTGVKVKHNGYEMKEVTDWSNLEADTYETITNQGYTLDHCYIGYYQYDADTGILTIKTKSFSPFEVEYKPVAKIGNTEFATLADAFAAVKDGETITIINDCETGASYIGITEEAAPNDPNPLTLSVDNVTLDLNGKTITVTHNFSFVIAGNNVTVKNGTIKSKELRGSNNEYYRGYPLVVAKLESGTTATGVNINNVIVYGGISAGGSVESNETPILGSGVVTLTDCTVQNGYSWTLYSQIGSTLNVVSGNYGVANSGLACAESGSTISITGGTFGADPSAYVPESGYVVIENDTDPATWTVMEFGDLFAGGSGTENDPYLISTKDEWNNLSIVNEGYFKLTADIDFENTVPTGKNGYTENNFHIDGNNKKIMNAAGPVFTNNWLYDLTMKNLTFENCVSNYSLICNYGSYAVETEQKFTNVDVVNCTCKGGSFFLPLVYEEYNVLFEDCDISGSILNNNVTCQGFVAAFVGNSKATVTVDNCTMQATITSSNPIVAGFLGSNGTIKNSSILPGTIIKQQGTSLAYAFTGSGSVTTSGDNASTCYATIIAANASQVKKNGFDSTVAYSATDLGFDANSFSINANGSVNYSGEATIAKLKIYQSVTTNRLHDGVFENGGFPTAISGTVDFTNVEKDSSLTSALSYITSVRNVSNETLVSDKLDCLIENLPAGLEYNEKGFVFNDGILYLDANQGSEYTSNYFAGTLKNVDTNSEINITVYYLAYDANDNLLGTVTGSYQVTLDK